MTAIEELDTAVLELDAQQRLSWLNSAAEECFSQGRERLLGQPLVGVDGVPEALGHAVNDTFLDHRPRRLHDCGLPGGQYDCTIHQLDEGRLLLELHSLDWYQQQLQLDRLEVQTGLMNLLRRNLGHEIRNPLGGIRGAAQMLAAELSDKELGDLALMIMREVDRIDELIKRFWQPSTRREPFDLHAPLEEAADLLQTEAPTTTLSRDYDPSIPDFHGDRSAFRQLFLNLLKNAQQAGASRLVMRSRVEHGSALFEEGRGTILRFDFEDDGDGVPDKLRPLLFLPMVTGRRSGTGLGLALVQQIAADHGGLVTYEPLAEGSRFSVHLPLCVNRAAGPDTEEQDP